MFIKRFLSIFFTVFSQYCFGSISIKKIEPFLEKETCSILRDLSYPDDKTLEKDAYQLRIYLSDKFDIFSQEKFAKKYTQTILWHNILCQGYYLNFIKAASAATSLFFIGKIMKSSKNGKVNTKKKLFKNIFYASLFASPAALHVFIDSFARIQKKKFIGNVLLFKSFFSEENFFKNRKLLKKQKNFFPPIKITTALFKEGYCLIDKENKNKVYTCKDFGEDLTNLFNDIYLLEKAVNEPQINALIEQFLKDREIGTKLIFFTPKTERLP